MLRYIKTLTTTVGNADAHGETQKICRPIRNSSGPKSGNSIDQLLFDVIFAACKFDLGSSRNFGNISNFVPMTGVRNKTTKIPKAISL